MMRAIFFVLGLVLGTLMVVAMAEPVAQLPPLCQDSARVGQTSCATPDRPTRFGYPDASSVVKSDGTWRLFGELTDDAMVLVCAVPQEPGAVADPYRELCGGKDTYIAKAQVPRGQPQGKPMLSLTAEPAKGPAPLSVTLAWAAKDFAPGTQCQAAGGWSGTRPLSGSETVERLTAGTTFVLTCTAPGATGSVNLEWKPATTNTDGSPYTDAAGYRISYGTNAQAPNLSLSIPVATTTTARLTNLPAGTYTYRIRSVAQSGAESVDSAPVTRPLTLDPGESVTASVSIEVTDPVIPNPPVFTAEQEQRVREIVAEEIAK